MDITGREKSPLSIWRKMKRKNISFEELSDIMAFRILVDTVPNCYAALGVIHGHYAMVPERFKDFISTPKPNGYRSLHTTIFGPEQRRIEVQIRTSEMHEIADLGVAAHWAYKQERRLTDGRQYRWIRGLLEILEYASGPEEFLENTKLEMFQDQVFCFTPKGDLIALPRGGTPVDFAYAVHSEVGDMVVGAKVNGRLVPLRTRLDNGDQVEIITGKGAGPSPAWERFVVTGKARSQIRRHLRTRQLRDYIDHGRDMLQTAARREQLEVGEQQLKEVLKGFEQKSVEDMLAAIGEGTLRPRVGSRCAPSQPAGREEGQGRCGRKEGHPASPTAAAARTRRPRGDDLRFAGGHGDQFRRLLPPDSRRQDRRRRAYRSRRRSPQGRLLDLVASRRGQ